METHEIYRCAGCGFVSMWPVPEQEVEDCSKIERSKRVRRRDWMISVGLMIVGIVMWVVH